MRRPDRAARVEQRSDLLSGGVDASEIRAFMAIAAMASPSEILKNGLAAMLTGNDVLEVEGLQRG